MVAVFVAVGGQQPPSSRALASTSPSVLLRTLCTQELQGQLPPHRPVPSYFRGWGSVGCDAALGDAWGSPRIHLRDIQGLRRMVSQVNQPSRDGEVLKVKMDRSLLT